MTGFKRLYARLEGVSGGQPGYIWRGRAGLLFGLVAIAIGCLTTSGVDRRPFDAVFSDPETLDKDLPTILVLMPYNKDAGEVYGAIKQEVLGEFNLVAREVSDLTSVANLERQLVEFTPKALILMNNTTVRLYQRYQEQQPAGTKFPPSVVLLTSFIHDAAASAENVVGIAYEIPGVTLFSNLRSLIDHQMERVGIVYRASLGEFVERQKKLMAVEAFVLVGEQVDEYPSPGDIRLAVKRLRNRGVDALWILNDNGILRPDLIVGGWMEALSKARLPSVVGVRALVSEKVPFGSFGVLPDHAAMGTQAANLLFDLSSEDWLPYSGSFDLPVSVLLVVDANQAAKLGFVDDYRNRVDVVVGSPD